MLGNALFAKDSMSIIEPVESPIKQERMFQYPLVFIFQKATIFFTTVSKMCTLHIGIGRLWGWYPKSDSKNNLPRFPCAVKKNEYLYQNQRT